MTAQPMTLYTEQGATFTFGFVYCRPTLDANGQLVLDANGDPVPGEPFDLTGCTARMQIRQKINDPKVILNATSGDPVDDAAIAAGAGRLVLGGTTGRIDIILTDRDTDLITIRKGVYDLELEWPLQPGEIRPRVERLLQGGIVNTLNVTREA